MKTLCSRALLAATLLTAYCAISQPAIAQLRSPHTINESPFADTSLHTEADFDKAYAIQYNSARTQSKNCILNRQVYGWHPAWSGSAYKRYDFALLTTVAYYSYEVDPKTGSYASIHQWRETELVDMAHQAGSQVELTASLHGKMNTSRFLGNLQARITLCDSLIGLVQEKKADGICIDFKDIAATQAAAFADCIDSLAAKLRRWRKEATLSIVLYPQSPDQGYDYPRLNQAATRFLIAAPSASKPGPTSPLHSSPQWGQSSFEASISHFVSAGIPKKKLLPTVPYYGYEWPRNPVQPLARPLGAGKLVLLREYDALDSSAYLEWDSASTTGWLPRRQGKQETELWIDQVSSLTEKYALVKQKDLAGVAIWALGYDHPSDRYWDLLRGQFADCGATQKDQLAQDTKPVIPGLEGQTSAERNVWNWVWMIGGGIIAIAIILLVKKYM